MIELEKFLKLMNFKGQSWGVGDMDFWHYKARIPYGIFRAEFTHRDSEYLLHTPDERFYVLGSYTSHGKRELFSVEFDDLPQEIQKRALNEGFEKYRPIFGKFPEEI